MDKVLIGKVTSPVGLKGEVRVYNYSDRTQVYEETEEILVGDVPRRIESMRPQKNMLVIRFEGINSREDAEGIRNAELFVMEEDLPKLEEGEIYLRDLIGMEVVEVLQGLDDEGGERVLGPVVDVIDNEFQDILKVRTSGGAEVMIPAVDPIVVEIDEEERTITVDLPEGLLEL